MDRFGIANTAVNQRNKIMENRKIFIRAECAPSGTYRADRAPDGRSRSCRRSGPDGAMRFSEFRRSVEAISHRMFAAALRMSEVNGTVASPPRSMPKCRPPRGVRPRAARPGTDAAHSQLSGTGRANMAEILAGRGADAPTARSPSQDNRSREERLSAAPCRFRPAVFRTAFRRIRRQNPGTALSCPSPPRSDRGGRRIPSARTGSGSAV